MVPHQHHTKTNHLNMTSPSTTPVEPEPISLEQFNRTAADLDTKGAITLATYRKFLSKQK